MVCIIHNTETNWSAMIENDAVLRGWTPRKGRKDSVSRQRHQAGKDVQQVRMMKDNGGNGVLTDEESAVSRWKEYFEKLMNEENEREGWMMGRE